jgi:predicted methyltransferase
MYIFLLGISVLLRHFEICKDDFLLTLAIDSSAFGNDIQKEIRELNLIIGDMRTEMEKMDGFEQKTQTSFMHIIKFRLKALDTVKWLFITMGSVSVTMNMTY